MLDFDDQAQSDRPQLAIHIKADVQGSAEAVRDAVEVHTLLQACVSRTCLQSTSSDVLEPKRQNFITVEAAAWRRSC